MTKKNEITWRWKHKPGNVDAEVAGTELERIRTKRGGVLKPVDILSDAKRANSPLHDYFEWDDEVAGEKYRLEQARFLIKNIEFIIEKPEKTTITRAYINVYEEDSEWERTDQAVRSAEKREAIRVRAVAELESWLKKYKILGDLGRDAVLAALVEAIDIALEPHREEVEDEAAE